MDIKKVGIKTLENILEKISNDEIEFTEVSIKGDPENPERTIMIKYESTNAN